MQIQAKGEILINKKLLNVFAFIANLENDSQWRKEINETKMSGKAQLGVLAKESSYLSKRVPAHVLDMSCTQFSLNDCVTYTTLPYSPFYLQSIRKVVMVNDNQTKFIYEIIFDKSIVKHGLGFNLPSFLIGFVANQDMKKYLSKLKVILEDNI